MTEPIETGGPAFPYAHPIHGSGLSIRDYFAAAALQGRIACDEQIGFDDAAKEAY